MATPTNTPRTGASFTLSKKIGAARLHEITTVEDFTTGYRAREDTSYLKPTTLVQGSHDVLTNTSGRVGSRKGYTLDGSKSSVNAPIRAPFDWEMGTGYIHHLRAGFLVNNDGKLQLRYVDTLGALGTVNSVYWLDLMTSLTSTYFRYANYWDTTNLKSKLLMVNRTKKIYEWSGAIGTIASVTSNTIVLNGTLTTAQLNFDSSGSVINNGITYTYSGVSGQTLTGVSPSPVGSIVNSPVYQIPIPSSDFSSLTFTNTPSPATYFTCDEIAQLNNQVFIASLSSNQVYMSKVGTYVDYSQSLARLQYEGEMFTTKGAIKAFVNEDKDLYISAGLDEWYITDFTQTTVNTTTGTTLTYETGQLLQLKTTAGQATISPYATSKIKNQIVYISNEPILNSLGQVANYLMAPVVSDLSSPIVLDMNAYDFTDAWVAYNKQFIFMGVPKMGLFRMFNMTNPKNEYWEAPINIALSGITFAGTQIIGHSYGTSESYILFNGYSDRAPDVNTTGLPISCLALFAFQELGVRSRRKSFNKFWVEGYMQTSTILNVGLLYRSPNAGTNFGQTLTIKGTDPIVLIPSDTSSLGKDSIGKNPLAGTTQYISQINLPPYFAVAKTSTKYPYLAYQPGFSSYGVNQVWELLSYGNNASPTTEVEVDLTY